MEKVPNGSRNLLTNQKGANSNVMTTKKVMMVSIWESSKIYSVITEKALPSGE